MSAATFFTQVHHTVSRNVLKVRGWLTHLLKFGEMVIWICFEAKSYFFPLENWHPALSSHLLKFGEIVFVPHLISYLHIVCTPNLLNPSVPMETIVSQVNMSLFLIQYWVRMPLSSMMIYCHHHHHHHNSRVLFCCLFL